MAALALWVAHPVIFAFVLAVVLAWPLIKFAIKSWLAGFFGAEGVEASGLFKPRKRPERFRRPPRGYYDPDDPLDGIGD